MCHQKCAHKGNYLIIIIIATINFLNNVSFLLSSILAFFPWSLKKHVRIQTLLSFSSGNVCTSFMRLKTPTWVAAGALHPWKRLRWSSSEVATWFMAISPAATAVWMMPTWHGWWKLGKIYILLSLSEVTWSWCLCHLFHVFPPNKAKGRYMPNYAKQRIKNGRYLEYTSVIVSHTIT